MKSIKLILVDRKDDLPVCWRSAFARYPVEVVTGDLFALEADAVVSPANSFGIMDGGLDGKLRDFFGMQIEQDVRARIRESYQGEALVGQAFCTPTHHDRFPLLITAPTMRVPADVSDSVNAYLAMRAILNAALEHPDIASVVCSGLCSLSGRMSSEVVARQMAAGWENVLLDQHSYSHWRHQRDFEQYLKCRTEFLPDDS